MIQLSGAQRDPRFRRHGLARFEIVIADVGGKNFRRHRKQRGYHHVLQHMLDGCFCRSQVPGPNSDFVGGDEQRHKKRHTADMIEVRVGQKNVGI